MNLGPYVLCERIASGGMADVYLADDTRLPGGSYPVVIKCLRDEHRANPDMVRMFADEGRLHMTLSHANVVKVLDFGWNDGLPYLVFEYLEGADVRAVLRALRREGKTLGVPLSLCLLVQLGEALDYVHNARDAHGEPLAVVHRDVSPHNIIVRTDGVVKLVDFGIAKSRTNLAQTAFGVLKGKVAYMAPEQLRSEGADHRADLYALGVLLYEALLGRRPYRLSAPGELALMIAVSRGEIRRPRQVDPTLDPELERMLLRALAPTPEGRYADAGELVADVRRYADTKGIRFDRAALARLIQDLFGPGSKKRRFSGGKPSEPHVATTPSAKTTVEKSVVGSETYLLVKGALDDKIRWGRLFSGLEGEVRIECLASLVVTEEGARHFARAVSALGKEVEELTVLHCPKAVVRALREEAAPARLEGRCSLCRTSSALLGDACVSCHGPLVFSAHWAWVTESGARPSTPMRLPKRFRFSEFFGKLSGKAKR